MNTVRNITAHATGDRTGTRGHRLALVGSEQAIPTLLGGLIGVVPNAFLAARVMSPRAGSSARSLLQAGWLGEIGKLAIAALLFAVVFVNLKPLHPGFLFTGYIATSWLCQWACCSIGDAKGSWRKRVIQPASTSPTTSRT